MVLRIGVFALKLCHQPRIGRAALAEWRWEGVAAFLPAEDKKGKAMNKAVSHLLLRQLFWLINAHSEYFTTDGVELGFFFRWLFGRFFLYVT